MIPENVCATCGHVSSDDFGLAFHTCPRCICLSSFDGSGDGRCPVHGPETEEGS